MKDNYGRIIDYMRISITDRCNLRCKYCMPEDVKLVGMDNLLTYEEIERIAKAAVKEGIRKFKITGGEPLVRRGCVDLIGRIKSIPGVEQVTMTTNGVLLGRYLPELLKNGLDAVNISLDTLKPEVFQSITGRNELQTVLNSIDQAIEAGLPVKINTVLQRKVNDSEWLDLANLTREKALDVRFIEMMPIGYGKNFDTIYNEDLLLQLQEIYSGIKADKRIHGNGPAIYYQIPGAKGSIGFISAIHGKFCASCNRIRLTSMGKLKPCLCFGESVDLMGILRQEADEKGEIKLQEAIHLAISKKPQSHKFDTMNEITESKKMIEIGG